MKRYKNFLAMLIILILSASIPLFLSNSSFIKAIEYKAYDLTMSMAKGFRPKPEDVIIFYVDEKSLKDMEQNGVGWPWPRELYGSIINFCKRAGAKAVLFDLFFSEGSVYGVEDDRAFDKTLSRDLPSYFVLFLSKDAHEEDPMTKIVLDKSRIKLDGSKHGTIESYNSIKSLPIDGIAKGGSGFGNAMLLSDSDGIYRRVPLVFSLDEEIIPLVGLKVVADIRNISSFGFYGNKFKFGEDLIPLDDRGNVLINYYGGVDVFKTFSLSDILVSQARIDEGLQPSIDPKEIDGKIVVIGLAAPGLYDLKPTPISRTYPGPEVHATIMQNILSSDFIAPLGGWVLIMLTVVASSVAVFLLSYSKDHWQIILVIISSVALILAAKFILFVNGISLMVVTPLLSFSLATFSTILRKYLTEARKKREIRRAFAQYLSPEVVKEISNDPDAMKLGGETREITIFFSDIADFTTISERTRPEDLVLNLNSYFSMTTHLIQKSKGTLDKYIGDAIMAFWGAPLSLNDHAQRAVLTALEIQMALKDNSFKTRIGIHTGRCVVGNIGSDVRFNYTVIGDAVNLSSRLEGLNKVFGTRILVSGAAFEGLGTIIEGREIGKVQVKGKTEAIAIYEPLGEKGNFGFYRKDVVERFCEGYLLYAQGKFAEALKVFNSISTSDPVATLYVGECERLMQMNPKNFDGVMVFTNK